MAFFSSNNLNGGSSTASTMATSGAVILDSFYSPFASAVNSPCSSASSVPSTDAVVNTISPSLTSSGLSVMTSSVGPASSYSSLTSSTGVIPYSSLMTSSASNGASGNSSNCAINSGRSSMAITMVSPQLPHAPIDDKNTLWMGDLDPWMDENFVKQVWFNFGDQVNVKVIRNKLSGQNAGYCFVEFSNSSSAAKALMSLNGTPIPGTAKFFKLNWASGGGLSDKKDYIGPEFSIFVGDLGPEVNDLLLHSIFAQHYSSCRTAKVVTDSVTGLSRGYGFVRFIDEVEQQRAMIEMQGQYCGSRPMRISVATPKNRVEGGNWTFINGNWNVSANLYHDPNNTTVFVGGLVNGYCSEEDLMRAFAPFGPISYVKIPPGKGCGFVSFVHRQSAEQAITQLNGAMIGPNRIRLSWGRNSAIGSNMSSPAMSNGYIGGNWKNCAPQNFSFGSASSSPLPLASPEKPTPNSSPYDIRSNGSEPSGLRPFENDSIWRTDVSLFSNSVSRGGMLSSPIRSSPGEMNFTPFNPSTTTPSPPTPGSQAAPHPVCGGLVGASLEPSSGDPAMLLSSTFASAIQPKSPEMKSNSKFPLDAANNVDTLNNNDVVVGGVSKGKLMFGGLNEMWG